MLTEQLKGMMLRELKTLRNELLAFEDERQIWSVPPGTTNSAGTLALHLTGNLRHYLGSQFGGTGYLRDRDREFQARDIPRTDLLADIDDAMAEVTTALDAMNEGALGEPYPQEVGGVGLQTGEFLLHLAVHLGYHLGQVDYHRRTVTGSGRVVRALNIRDLSTARASGQE
jgi:uncharacterized damage-inducible protein DinB